MRGTYLLNVARTLVSR